MYQFILNIKTNDLTQNISELTKKVSSIKPSNHNKKYDFDREIIKKLATASIGL